MSSKDDMKWKDQVNVILRGPDGKIKDIRSSVKLNPIIVLLALILFIPISIYRTLFAKSNR